MNDTVSGGRVYLALGDSISIDQYTGVDALGDDQALEFRHEGRR